MDAAIASMTTLNKKAAEVIAGFPVHTMTDVTGFGLVAHAREMALASHVSMKLFASQIPMLDGALDCVRAGHIPGGLVSNRDFAECVVGYEDGVSDEVKALLFDPQTAGGLLISVEASAGLVRALNDAGVPAVEIGDVLPASKPLIHVLA
jgi:selenide, water dikinase